MAYSRDHQRKWYQANRSQVLERSRQWAKAHPEARIKRGRKNRLKRLYNLTLSEYDRLLQQQGGVCAICHKPESRLDRVGRTSPLSVDHCHQTGKRRLLLCHACNTGLGKFNDSSDLLRAAASYLDQYDFR